MAGFNGGSEKGFSQGTIKEANGEFERLVSGDGGMFFLFFLTFGNDFERGWSKWRVLEVYDLRGEYCVDLMKTERLVSNNSIKNSKLIY